MSTPPELRDQVDSRACDISGRAPASCARPDECSGVSSARTASTRSWATVRPTRSAGATIARRSCGSRHRGDEHLVVLQRLAELRVRHRGLVEVGAQPEHDDHALGIDVGQPAQEQVARARVAHLGEQFLELVEHDVGGVGRRRRRRGSRRHVSSRSAPGVSARVAASGRRARIRGSSPACSSDDFPAPDGPTTGTSADALRQPLAHVLEAGEDLLGQFLAAEVTVRVGHPERLEAGVGRGAGEQAPVGVVADPLDAHPPGVDLVGEAAGGEQRGEDVPLSRRGQVPAAQVTAEGGRRDVGEHARVRGR